MQFSIALSFFVALAAAASLENRAALHSNTETIDVENLPENVELDNIKLITHNQKSLASTQATCPAGYPWYCSRYNFCCPPAAKACCPRSCCGHSDGFCGSDGLCYRYT